MINKLKNYCLSSKVNEIYIQGFFNDITEKLRRFIATRKQIILTPQNANKTPTFLNLKQMHLQNKKVNRQK